MGCSSSADSKPQEVPQLRRRLSLGDVDLVPENAAEEEGVSDQDRSLMMQLTQGEIMDFIKSDEMVGRRYSIGSETDQQGRLARSFQDKTVKLQGAQFDTKNECLGYACKKGLKPEAPNQDSFFIMKVEDKFSLYGVFDGHGSKGHDVSNFVKDNLPKILLSHDNLLEDPKGVLTKTFEKTQYLIEKATQLKQIDAARSGTTCSVVLHMHKDNMLYVAHVGDSRVVLGKQAIEDGKNTLKAVDLTTDHKPDLPEERKRIEAAGGVVLFDGGWNYRVYARGKKDARGKRYPGLNMSRSMGDLKGFHDAGISAEPDVKSRPLKAAENGGEKGKASLQPSEPTVTMVSLDPGHDKFMMLCSDGVWEFISSQQAVEMVGKFPPAEAEKAAEHLAAAAWDQWMQELEGQVVDDITSVVVHFTAPKA